MKINYDLPPTEIAETLIKEFGTYGDQRFTNSGRNLAIMCIEIALQVCPTQENMGGYTMPGYYYEKLNEILAILKT